MFINIVKGVLLAICIFSFIAGNAMGAEKLKVISEGGKMVEVEAEGRLAWIKMTNFPDNSWKELALVDEEGTPIAILIGEKVEEILDKEGEEVKVKGLSKPEMKVKGKDVAVIEVKEIELLTEER